MIENIIHYFDHIPSLHRALILAGGITFFWLIEGVIPLANFTYNKWKHASINILFTVTTIVINFSFALLIVKTSDWVVAHKFGLLQLVTMHLLQIKQVALIQQSVINLCCPILLVLIILALVCTH